MEFHRDTAIGADQHHHAGLTQLLEFAAQGWRPQWRQLGVGETLGMLDRGGDVGDRVGLKPAMPAIIVEEFGILARACVVPEAFNRRRPVKRAAGDTAARGARPQRLDYIWRIFRRRGQAGMLEIINADFQPEKDLLGTVGVTDNPQAARMRLVDDGAGFCGGHLVLVDQLDDINAGIGQRAHMGTGLTDTAHAPAEGFRPRIGLMLDEGTGDVEIRARQLAGIDAVADRDGRLERRTEIADRGDPSQQKLYGGGRHDLVFEPVEIGTIPVIIIGMPVEH